MENKNDLIIKLSNRLKDVFVNDFDSVKSALDDINQYLKLLEIDYVYNYDQFCKDFLNMTSMFIEKLSFEEMTKMDTYTFVQEVLSVMIYQKINDILSDNEELRKFKQLQHILLKKNS